MSSGLKKMSLESLSTEFSTELSRYLNSAVQSELEDVSFESCSTIRPNARDTDQISMRMDQINQELEDIKKSFNTTRESNSPKPSPTGLDRFDSIPANIKAYIRQEIKLLNERLPDMIAQVVRQELAVLISNPTAAARPHKSAVKESRPPWDNEFTSDRIPKLETVSSRLKRS